MTLEKPNILDDIDLIKKLDRCGMYSYLCSISRDSYESYKNAKSKFSFQNHNITNIVGAGMGGSGMAPTVIGSLFNDELTIPYIVSQDYNIPEFANSNTLLMAISNSGETEEIINQYNQANNKEAKIIVIGQGGKLIKLAKKDNKPNYIYSTEVPARISFAFVFGPSIACLENIGVVHKDKEEGLKEAIEIVKELNSKIGVNVPTKNNIAKQIAIKLKTRIPILYIEPPFDSLGHRFTKMFNENARMFAFHNRFPEIRHNEIMIWKSTSEFRQNFIPILLRDNKNNSRMETEIDVVKEFLESRVEEVIEFRAEGKSKIARFFYLLHLTDMISYYEAILLNKDPCDTPELTELKNILAEIQENAKAFCKQVKDTEYKEYGQQINNVGYELSKVDDPIRLETEVRHMLIPLSAMCEKMPAEDRGEACEILKLINDEKYVEHKLSLINMLLSKFSSQMNKKPIIQEKNDEIEKILDKWGFRLSGFSFGERELKKASIEKWLQCFEPSEREDALLILNEIQYYDAITVNAYIKKLSEEIKNIFKTDLQKVKFYPLGESPSSSGGNFLYMFRKELGLLESPFPYEPINKTKYLFSWEELERNDREKLRDYLNSNYGVDWVKTANIARTGNSKTIMITSGKNIISLNLYNKNTELNLIIDNDKKDKFIVKTENGKLNIYETNFSKTTALVFFDDIIGSGKQAVRFAKNHLQDIEIDKYYVALLAFREGYEKVKQSNYFKDVKVHTKISDESRAFSPKSQVFPDPNTRERIKRLCEKYGALLYPEHPLGYEDSQALIVFQHNTPNNTLPIIWASGRNEAKYHLWYPVWERIKI